MSGTQVLQAVRPSRVRRHRAGLVGIVLAGVIVALGLALLSSGTMRIGAGDLWSALIAPGAEATPQTRVLWRIRVPRMLTGALVGGALGLAGAVFQTVTRNPLGSPDVIGFTAGAATGAILQIVLSGSDPLAVAVMSMLSGLAVAALVLGLSHRTGHAQGSALVLVGIGVAATLSGVNSLLLVMGDLDQSIAAQLWLAGSLNTRTWAHVVPVGLGLAVLVPIVLALAKPLALFGFGEEKAASLGVPVARVRLIAILAAVGMTALATAAAGPIGFIALAGPQLARRLCGGAAIPLPASALMGAVLLMTADLLAQRAPPGLTLPVGLSAGILGGAYLLWLVTRRPS